MAITAMWVLACRHAPPSIEGVAPTPLASNALWTPSPSVVEAARRDALGTPPAVAAGKDLMLADIVDIALRNSPETKLSWARARSAADAYGASQGSLYPQLSAALGITRQLSSPTPGRPAQERAQFGPSLNLGYTVLDFGGRSGSIDVARQTAIAAALSHNAAVSNTILHVETAAFAYLSTRAQRDAARVALDEANRSLDAANERQRVGLATIADVLQARTARSQAELELQTLEGTLLVTRGGLAVAMGLPANSELEVPDVPVSDSVHSVAESIDSLIEVAVRDRPELATARAQAAAAQSQIRVARSATLPNLALSAAGASNGSNVSGYSGPSYSLNVGVQIPVFSGFSKQYDQQAAAEQYRAAMAEAAATKQQVVQEVFTAYYTLRTSIGRVQTSRDLLISATQSETVARQRYREGVGSIVDLLIAQSALANARAQAVDARWQWRSSLAQLAHDVGVLDVRGGTSFGPLTPAPSPTVRPD